MPHYQIKPKVLQQEQDYNPYDGKYKDVNFDYVFMTEKEAELGFDSVAFKSRVLTRNKFNHKKRKYERKQKKADN